MEKTLVSPEMICVYKCMCTEFLNSNSPKVHFPLSFGGLSSNPNWWMALHVCAIQLYTLQSNLTIFAIRTFSDSLWWLKQLPGYSMWQLATHSFFCEVFFFILKFSFIKLNARGILSCLEWTKIIVFGKLLLKIEHWFTQPFSLYRSHYVIT